MPELPDDLLRVVRVFPASARPRVEVLVNDEWVPGVLRKWSEDSQGRSWATVTWGRSPDRPFLDTFPADRVRDDADSARSVTCA